MGLITIYCPQCNKAHLWFSGNIDQRCKECTDAYPATKVAYRAVEAIIEEFVSIEVYKALGKENDRLKKDLKESHDEIERLKTLLERIGTENDY